METPVVLIEPFFESAEAFAKTTFELSKLRALETATVVAASLASRIAVILMMSMFMIVLNIGIALWLGDLLGRAYYGFFIVAIFYLIIGFIFHYFLHSWLKKPVSDLIISQAL